MKKEQIITSLLEILKNSSPSQHHEIKIDQDTKFHTLLSSLDLVEFSLSVEEQFEVTLESHDIQKYNTINKLTEYIINYNQNTSIYKNE